MRWDGGKASEGRSLSAAQFKIRTTRRLASAVRLLFLGQKCCVLVTLPRHSPGAPLPGQLVKRTPWEAANRT